MFAISNAYVQQTNRIKWSTLWQNIPKKQDWMSVNKPVSLIQATDTDKELPFASSQPCSNPTNRSSSLYANHQLWSRQVLCEIPFIIGLKILKCTWKHGIPPYRVVIYFSVPFYIVSIRLNKPCDFVSGHLLWGSNQGYWFIELPKHKYKNDITSTGSLVVLGMMYFSGPIDCLL